MCPWEKKHRRRSGKEAVTDVIIDRAAGRPQQGAIFGKRPNGGNGEDCVII